MRELEVIDYPGRVENVDNMITSLGGIVRISQVFSAEQKHLELRFHSKNPFNKPANSDSSPNSGILISVKVRRSKRNKLQPPTYEVNLLGYCQNSHTFPNLFDFQYLPLYKNLTTQSFAFSPNFVVPESNTDTQFFSNSNVPLFCQPVLFARSGTTRESSILRNDINEDGQQDNLGVVQKSNIGAQDIVAFNMVDTFPNNPDSQLLKRMKVKYVSDEELKTVKNLFEKYPIWTRVALMYESKVSNDKLKCILPYCAYYFSSGPWRGLSVRYGYDPRKDFQSRHYQRFDFRIRVRSGFVEYVANRLDVKKKLQDNPNPSVNELAQDIYYPYLDESKLPRSRQCVLRYCDIHIPKIQEMLEKLPSPHTGVICNERTGWLPSGFDIQVRQIVSSTYKILLRNHYQKEQTANSGSIDDDDEQQLDCDEEDIDDEMEEPNDDEEYFDENDFLSQTADNICNDLQYE